MYTGLWTLKNTQKRSWFRFAGGNRLTLEAPRTVRRGHAAILRGPLTCSRLGGSATGVAGKNLDLPRRVAGRWRTLKTVTTRATGAYSRGVRPTSSSRYRLVWGGVIISPSRRISVQWTCGAAAPSGFTRPELAPVRTGWRRRQD